MEALISVTVAALAVIDMAKASTAPHSPQDRAQADSPPGTHTRTLIYATRAAHNGLIPPLCAVPCFLIPSLVCDTRGTGARADPRKRDGWIPAGSRGEQRTIARIPLKAAVRAAP